MPEPRLQIIDLTAGYRAGLPIINQVSLQLAEGEILAIIGPNGAGKSTLVKSIAGLTRIESGEIKVGGVAVTGIRPDHLGRRGLAYVPQLGNVFETLSVQRNLILAARRCTRDRRGAVLSMHSQFPMLAEKANVPAGSLSGGQRQLLAIAMALVSSPQVLLLDEPSAGLSPRASQETLAKLRSISRQGVGILLVEQNARAALQLADSALVLAEGRVQHAGPAASLLDDPVLGRIYLGQYRAAAATGAAHSLSEAGTRPTGTVTHTGDDGADEVRA